MGVLKRKVVRGKSILRQNINRIIAVDWIAQKLLYQFEKLGPLIELLIDINTDSNELVEDLDKPFQYLIIQGSFDPPTTSHIDIISKAIKCHSKLNPSEPIKVILLLSLSHVDKKMDVLKRSLFGYRVEMLEKLFSSLEIKIPISIGLSNVARYIDLIDATKQISANMKKVSFIMGMDVFKKLLDPSYYQMSLEQVLPLIFRADYYIAGRKDVFSKEDFSSYLKKNLDHNFHKNVHFLSLQKSHRFLSASLIRDKYSKNESIQETYIHSTILKYLEENNIYRLTPKWMATKIAIQTVVNLTLTADRDQIIANEVLKRLLPEIKTDISLQEKLISEYKSGKMVEIRKKWTQITNLIS
jgi:nicotinic acid mononucleotide adenylyltransferase